MTDSDLHRSVEAVWRLESTKLVAALVRITRDVGLAEDLAQDALEAALSQWPESGIPDNPAAWLMAVAKRRAIDGFRRRERQDRAYGALAEGQEDVVAGIETAVDHVEDDVLRLMFICCHPVLGDDARRTLTLRLVAGLTTSEIARSFLTSEATIGARITRAKKTLADVDAPTEEPADNERAERLEAVLAVIYLLFNEGYSATAGEDWMRPALSEEAVRLGRLLVGLVPDDPEVLGLLALMEMQLSRTAARTGPDGTPVLLLDQDRSRWDQLLIRRGLAALERATAIGGSPGPYVLQGEIAACHARARAAEDTEWARIASLYESLAAITGSAVVELNRAVAVSMAHGPDVALSLIDQLAELPELSSYHLLPSVRGDLLAKLGRSEEARVEFERAASLTQNEQERALLLARAADC
ncbi:RNA polymerase sigma factor (sigma-70 family) [Aeromicrobium panaciterrae]|uniref:RNA polymerase sigma factor (Sigma-70 family) n=1 Tax=Aeromicrobium panaciterrae TaxID=363861 RepID=A0ABU1UJ58_9ACTN|nr:RNA polymerase sigma factor [Aeromicrobium panaciterrae]MDR7085196.1 RNA polymerase sigma factor (sigma-70 family) [Aeromicrobium panaciterrae]